MFEQPKPVRFVLFCLLFGILLLPFVPATLVLAQNPAFSTAAPEATIGTTQSEQSTNTDPTNITTPEPAILVPQLENPSFDAPGVVPNNPLALTLSPISLIIETDPGVTVQREVRLRNNGSTPERLKITLGTFTADDTGQRARLQPANPNDPSMSWLTYPATPFTIQPGEWATIPVSFNPPAEAALTYYYSLIFSRADKVAAQEGETVVNVSSALLVLTTVRSPNAKKELTLTGFAAKQPIIEFLPQELEITIRNIGNVHLAPDGNVFVDGQGQKDLAILSINQAAGMVLPNSSRTFTVKWADGFPLSPAEAKMQAGTTSPPGFELLGMHLDTSKVDRLRVGKYTAHLLMIYDNGERDVPVEASISFWVIPWKLILGGIIIIVSVLSLFRNTLVQLLRKIPALRPLAERIEHPFRRKMT